MSPMLESVFKRANFIVLSGALVIILFVFSIGGSIAGSYALTLHAIASNATATAQAAKARQHLALEVEVRNAKASCMALTTLDKAGNGIDLSQAGPKHQSELALSRLFHGIHDVVEASHCSELLTGDYHISGGQILPGRE